MNPGNFPAVKWLFSVGATGQNRLSRLLLDLVFSGKMLNPAMRSILRPSHLLIPLAALIALPLAVPPLGPVRALAQAGSAQAGSEMVKLTFPNADVRDVLTQYELLVGKRVLYDNTVQGQVNINVPEVPKEEAIRIIEITLLMNGYHLVPSDIDPNLVKATGIGRAPRSVGVPIFAEPEPIPDNEQVIMYMVKLRYADPTELAQVLQQAMPASRQEYSPNIVALPKAQALLVTENTSVLRGLMRIIRSADLEPTRVDGEFITLQRASAKDVVQMLEKLFEKPQTGATPGAPRPAVVAPPKPADGANPAAAAPSPLTTVELGGMTEDSMVAGKVRLTADERTNRIYVVSRPSNIPVLRKLIQQFDEDVPFNEPLVRPLKFVSAGDILDALVKAVSDPGTKDTGVSGAGGNTQGRNQAQTNNAGTGSQFGNRGGLGGSSGGLSGGGSGESLSLQGEQKEIIPTTVLVGNARIMADKRRNAIMVIGSQDMKEKVGNILDQLDVRSPQVMLTTVIGELTLKDGQDFGVNYLLHNGRRDLLTSGTSGSAVTASGNSMSLNLAQLLADPRSTRMMTAGAGGISGFISAGDSLAAIVTALESTSKFKVTHRPTLFASNNKTATIISGERIAVITGSQSSPVSGGITGNSVVNQVQYINVNLKLQVIPLINSDKEVNLDILQTLAEITGTTQIKDSSNVVNEYPVISDRQLSTTVLVPNEGTLVLGGLVKDSHNKTRAGIPVLGNLPLLGGLFRTTSTKKDRTELVVLIRPSVSIGPEDVYEIRDRNMKPMRIPVNLEDDLVLPDPAASKSGKRSVDPAFSSTPKLKPFRANADTVQAADVTGARAQTTPPPTPATPAEAVPAEKNAAEAADAVPKKKKPVKAQPKPAAE
jgi:type II secretion system protein D